MNAHWPKHQEYHKEQKQRAKVDREGGQLDRTRSIAEAEARHADETGDEYTKRCAAALALNALALMSEGGHNAAAKAWRKIIKDWPEKPGPHFNLALVMQRSGRFVEAAAVFLKAMELCKDGTKPWTLSVTAAFDLLKLDDCRDVPKPEWWNDEALKALSARVVAVAPDKSDSCAMRARVLCGGALIRTSWNAGPRTAAEIKEAATWYRRAARVSLVPTDKLFYEQLASACDESADPLLAKEEAEAAKARAAAEAEAEKARAATEAEAAEARNVAEAKAKAAAEELLADEEKEQKQAAASTTAGKAKQGKGKRSKGKR